MNQTFHLTPADSKDTVQENENLQREIQILKKTNQQLQDELQQMKNFMRAMSHDLGNPLNGLDYLLDNFNIPVFTENWVTYYQIFQLAYITIRDLKENTDSFMNTGNDSPLIQEVDPITLVDSLISFSKPLASGRSIQLKLSVSTETPEKIFTDRARLTRIIFNLLSNAIKFSPQNATVFVSTSESKGYFVLTVQDQGIGIPDDKLQSIFEPGMRLDKSAQGLGIGLHVSKTYANQLKGSLTVKSKLEHGSTFTLTLPEKTTPQTLILTTADKS